MNGQNSLESAGMDVITVIGRSVGCEDCVILANLRERAGLTEGREGKRRGGARRSDSAHRAVRVREVERVPRGRTSPERSSESEADWRAWFCAEPATKARRWRVGTWAHAHAPVPACPSPPAAPPPARDARRQGGAAGDPNVQSPARPSARPTDTAARSRAHVCPLAPRRGLLSQSRHRPPQRTLLLAASRAFAERTRARRNR